jgi:hypothetical protein
MLATSCGNAVTRASSEVVAGSSGNTISVALLPPLLPPLGVRQRPQMPSGSRIVKRARQDSNLRPSVP